MKKYFVFLTALILTSGSLVAREQIGLTVGKIDSNPIGHHVPRSPMVPPNVYIEDHTLFFMQDHEEFTIIVGDPNGEAVYETTIGTSDTEICLPNALQGYFQIVLLTDEWVFTGNITL